MAIATITERLTEVANTVISRAFDEEENTAKDEAELTKFLASGDESYAFSGKAGDYTLNRVFYFGARKYGFRLGSPRDDFGGHEGKAVLIATNKQLATLDTIDPAELGAEAK